MPFLFNPLSCNLDLVNEAVPPGSGIVTLNGETDTTQAFAEGTSGTDFNIVSATGVHTFNIPTASSTNRGALSSADWSAFDAKVDGPGSSTDNAIVRFDGATGNLLKDSTVLIDDTGNITTSGNIFTSTDVTSFNIQLHNGLAGDEGGASFNVSAGNATSGGIGTPGDINLSAGLAGDEATYGNINLTGNVSCNKAISLSEGVAGGASGTFTSQDGKTVTVVNGIITSIV